MSVSESARVVVEGVGLHKGRNARVTLIGRPGAVTLGGTPIAELRVLATERATTVGEPRVATVEHLFAALAGLGAYEGIGVEVQGDELPLLDGGAARWCEAIARLGVVPRAPLLCVARAGQIEVDESRYMFDVAGSTSVEVDVDFGDAPCVRGATWEGDAADFCARIAPARTFGFARELDMLIARGLASHVTPESVVVVDGDVLRAAGAVPAPDEPARHKLLDLIGDLYVYGGPPRGRVRASRPGHTRTHAAMRRALREGLVAAIAC